MSKNSAAHQKKVDEAVRILNTTTGVIVPQAMIMAGFPKKDTGDNSRDQNLDLWFDSWETFVVEYGFATINKDILNMDETCLSLDGSNGNRGGRPTVTYYPRGRERDQGPGQERGIIVDA